MNPEAPLAASQLPVGSSRKPLIIVIILLALLLIGSLIFGYSAYSTGQDYKNNSDAKSAAAVSAAKTAQAAQLQAAFAEQAKSPFKTYQSSPTAGSITFDYPKSWSAYVDETGTGGQQLINGYFYPNQVPGINGTTAFALRVEMLNQDYSQIVDQLNSQLKNSQGGLTATAYIPPKMVGVANVETGTKFSGAIAQNKTGSILIIKVRDKTLKIYTESNDYLNDFNNTILATLKFAP